MKLKEAANYGKYQLLSEFEDDDDEDLSPAERALAAKADADLAKKGVKVKNFNPDKMVGQKKTAPEDDDEDQAPVRARKPEPKKGTLSLPKEKAGAEKGGGGEAAKSPRGDKVKMARQFLQDHPDARRGDFIKFMANHGMSAHYANTAFYILKNKLKEVFYITNDDGEVLAEGDQWTVFEDYSKRLLMFKREWTAKKRALGVGGKVKVSTL